MKPGATLGRYQLLRVLGRGGMGEVWEAVLNGFQGFRRRVALKLVPSEGPHGDTVARFVREARLGAMLAHPNVVATHDVGESEGFAWIAMELVDGATLRDLAREEPLGGRALVDAGLQACAALGHVHGLVVDGRPLALLHRDVKPSNLLVERSGVVKLADLGVARLQSERGGVGGTPAFMAPEQREGGGDARADLFGLGATLHRLGTRRPLLEGSPGPAAARRELSRLVADANAWRELDTTAPGLVDVLRRCLDPEPDRRFPNAAALADALASIRARQHGTSLADRLGQFRPELAPTPDPPSERAGGSTQARRGRLPRPRDPFVGRDADRAQLLAACATGGLVSLLGTGGTGKTRLALEVANALAGELPGGGWFVDLAEARDVDGVLQAVARTLDVGLDRADPVAQIGHALASHGRAIVVLDNLEQVVDAAGPLVARWVDAAPDVSFVATSRVALRVKPERRMPLGTLPVDEAAELFRARSPRRLDDDELASVAAVVEALDGLPLAIELAAARTRLVRVDGIRERLVDRMRLVAGGGTDRPERHRSLRASLDGSWELLVPWQQAAMAQLSVFEGGFALDAADAVLDLSSFPDAPWGLDVLEGLVDASLVRMDSVGERFRTLVSVQVYAAEHLAAPDAARAEARHGAWFAQHGSDASMDALYGRDAPERMALLGRELDNLSAAARRALARGDRSVALPATRAAVAFLRQHGPAARAEELLAAALAGDDGGSAARPLRIARGAVHRELGRHDAAIALLRAELARGDADASAQIAWTELGIALQESGAPGAREAHESARAVAEAHGDRRAAAQSEANLATVALALGRRDDARASLERALAVHREVSSPRFVGIALANLAMIEVTTGRPPAAVAYLEEAAAQLRRAGDRRSVYVCVGNLGVILLERGDPHGALRLLDEAWQGHREIGGRRFEAVAANQRGTVLSQLGRYEAAERMLSDALRLHREHQNATSELVAWCNLLDLRVRAGRPAEALAEVDELLARCRATDAARFAVLAAVTASEASVSLGRADDAARWLQTARDGGAKDAESAAWVAMAAGRVAFAAGDLVEAEVSTREALSGLRAFERARAHALLAGIATRRGDLVTARSERAAFAALAMPFGPGSPLALEAERLG